MTREEDRSLEDFFEGTAGRGLEGEDTGVPGVYGQHTQQRHAQHARTQPCTERQNDARVHLHAHDLQTGHHATVQEEGFFSFVGFCERTSITDTPVTSGHTYLPLWDS